MHSPSRSVCSARPPQIVQRRPPTDPRSWLWRPIVRSGPRRSGGTSPIRCGGRTTIVRCCGAKTRGSCATGLLTTSGPTARCRRSAWAGSRTASCRCASSARARRPRRPTTSRTFSWTSSASWFNYDAVPTLDPDSSDVVPSAREAAEQASDVGAIYGATPHLHEIRLRAVDDTYRELSDVFSLRLGVAGVLCALVPNQDGTLPTPEELEHQGWYQIFKEHEADARGAHGGQAQVQALGDMADDLDEAPGGTTSRRSRRSGRSNTSMSPSVTATPRPRGGRLRNRSRAPTCSEWLRGTADASKSCSRTSRVWAPRITSALNMRLECTRRRTTSKPTALSVRSCSSLAGDAAVSEVTHVAHARFAMPCGPGRMAARNRHSRSPRPCRCCVSCYSLPR